jgi:Predicted periplasmic or secreted lipoprotein
MEQMNSKWITALMLAGLSLTPVIGHATDDQDSDRSKPKAFVKDSVITTKIKTKLAAERPSTLVKVHVDTDAEGVVYLSGYAPTQGDIDKAVEIAHGTEGVRSVVNEVKVKKDD